MEKLEFIKINFKNELEKEQVKILLKSVWVNYWEYQGITTKQDILISTSDYTRLELLSFNLKDWEIENLKGLNLEFLIYQGTNTLKHNYIFYVVLKGTKE